MRCRRSWVHGNSSPHEASTAFIAFSAACCAWKPTTESAIAWSDASFSTASACSRALRRRSIASSNSGGDKDASLMEGAVYECAWHHTPPSGLLLRDNHHIDRHSQWRE